MTLGDFAHQLVVEGVPYFWRHHGDEVLQVAGVVAFGVCVVVSAGTCLLVGAALAAATLSDGVAFRDWSTERAVAYSVFSIVTLGTGSVAAQNAELLGPAARWVVTGGADVPAAIGSYGIENGEP